MNAEPKITLIKNPDGSLKTSTVGMDGTDYYIRDMRVVGVRYDFGDAIGILELPITEQMLLINNLDLERHLLELANMPSMIESVRNSPHVEFASAD